MTDAPAFDFYPERFWFAVEGWTDNEICRYWRLLGQQWMRDGLPEDMSELRGLARGSISDRLLAKFPVGGDGKRRNRFMETVRSAQRERIAKRRLGAEITNAKRGALRNGERVAQRPIERDAGVALHGGAESDTPPPTTHPNVLLEKEPKGKEDAQARRFPLPVEAENEIRQLYKRRNATPWSGKEIAAARRLTKDTAELLDDLRLFRQARGSGWPYYRKDILTLLNNWQAEIERANDFLGQPDRCAAATSPQNVEETDHIERAKREMDELAAKMRERMENPGQHIDE